MTRPRWYRHLTPERMRFIKFGTVGTSGLFINLGFVWIGHLVFSLLSPNTLKAASSALGIIVSVFTNFIINDAWTWGDRKKGPRKRDFIRRALRYYLASGLAIAIQFGTATALSIGLGWNLYIAQAIGILLGMLVNFFVNNFWTFRDHHPHAHPHPHPRAHAHAHAHAHTLMDDPSRRADARERLDSRPDETR